uniref:Uncharacterized protein n=1 Tax=Ananas comosus var. bracteatus TaxID=296719 RepID=A0A6V7QAD1_ANACO|nr:unnamed protein product [Ananas comosus var. bracteatus]
MSEGVHGVGAKKRTGGSKLQDLGAEAKREPSTRRVADDAEKKESDAQLPVYRRIGRPNLGSGAISEPKARRVADDADKVEPDARLPVTSSYEPESPEEGPSTPNGSPTRQHLILSLCC